MENNLNLLGVVGGHSQNPDVWVLIECPKAWTWKLTWLPEKQIYIVLWFMSAS